MGCGASSVAPAADAGGGTSLTRQLTAAIDRTSKSTRVSTLQREAIEEADALLPEYMRLIRQDLGASKLNAVIAKAMTRAIILFSFQVAAARL